MKLYYFLLKEFDDDTLVDLTTFLSSIDTSVEYDINVIINSPGGFSIHSKLFVEILKDYNYYITVMHAESAGFDFAVRSEAPVTILQTAYGMYHMVSLYIRYGDNMFADTRATLQEDLAVKYKAESEELYKMAGLTKKEIKRITQGKDVYFNEERLKEIFKDRLI